VEHRGILSNQPVRTRVEPFMTLTTIVVASEDARRRASLAWAISRDGHRVRVARAPLELLLLSGAVGSLLPPATPPDAIVLDVTGRSWGSLEMLEALAAVEPGPPVLALVAMPAQREQALRLGARATLVTHGDEGDGAAVRAELANRASWRMSGGTIARWATSANPPGARMSIPSSR
jgi:hypothetical protein